MVSREYLAYKISYLRKRIQELPDGRLGTFRGRSVIRVTYDPKNSKVTRHRYRRILTETTNGQRFVALVEESTRLRQELQKYMAVWEATYVGNPLEMIMPNRGFMDYDDFKNATPNMNTYPVKEGIEYKGLLLRSKNEMMGIMCLEKLGIEYKVEPEIDVKGNKLYPDIMAAAPEINKSAFVEIYGLSEMDGYNDKMNYKNKLYMLGGYRHGRDYIPFYTNSMKQFDVRAFEETMTAWLNLAAKE